MIDNLELIRLLYVEGSTHGSVMCKLARYAAEVLEKQDKRIAELEAENQTLQRDMGSVYAARAALKGER
jgi:hypothetical protein